MKQNLGRADLHIHSEHGIDSFSPIKKILEISDKKNLDIIAITDHNTIKGAKEAEKIAEGFNVKVIRGEEVSTKEGHLLALFIKECICARRPIADTISEIHKQGGLAVIPHPCNPFSHGVSLRTISRIYDKIDGIETFNASWGGWISREKIKKLNSKIFCLALTGGSDSHVSSHIGTGYTIFEGKNPEDLYNCIKSRTTKADGFFNFLGYCQLLINQPRRIIKKLSYKK